RWSITGTFTRRTQSRHAERGYNHFYNTFSREFGDRETSEIDPDEILIYMTALTAGCKRKTRRLRYVQTKAFFNFVINCLELAIPNPCDNNLLSKSFRHPKRTKRTVVGKEALDEVIFRCTSERDRIMLELMARSGMRIGEVLKMRPCDVEGRRITLEAPKSGRDVEYACMTESTAERLEKYIREKGIAPEDGIFKLSYSGARFVVKKAGDRADVNIKPHDFRLFACGHLPAATCLPPACALPACAEHGRQAAIPGGLSATGRRSFVSAGDA
ncbi:MAG: site-specific integrase, partial [bacterium]